MSPSAHHRVLSRLLFAIGSSAAASSCGGNTSANDPSSEQASDELQSSPGASEPSEEELASTERASAPCAQPQRFCLDGDAVRSAVAPASSEATSRYDDNGCLKQQFVRSSCCNPALGPGVREGELCCYEACDNVCCGRALVLGDRAVVSAPERRNDWLVSDATLTGVAHAARPELSSTERARLVELWQADALMEHASIASFARFGLQLLALGAPAQLVREAQQAGLDEIRHAETAFSITSRLAGRAIGPGKLPELGSALDTELSAVARATLVEGCIGETLAAVAAQEQARLAGDLTARAALLEVAEDETRHAQLAFRFLAWALARGGSELREALRREAEQRLAQLPEPAATDDVSTRALHHYGRLTADEQRALYQQARAAILRPAFAALLHGATARRPGAELRA